MTGIALAVLGKEGEDKVTFTKLFKFCFDREPEDLFN